MGQMFGFIRKNIAIISLCLIAIFYIANNLIWLYSDGLPPAWDQAYHLNLCLKFMRTATLPISLGKIDALLGLSHYYPPFFYLSSIPFVVIFRFSFDSAVLTNFLYLAILIFSVYKIGKYFFNKNVGLGAVSVILLYPEVYALSRELLLDFALLATVSLAQYAILISKGGMDKRRCWFLGFILAISMLTKWTAIIFLSGSLFYAIFVNWPKERKERMAVSIGIFVSLTIFFLFVLPWYLKVGKGLLADSLVKWYGRSIMHPKFSNLEPISFYPLQLKDGLISASLFYFTLVGLVTFFAFSRKWNFIGFFLSWILPPLLIFSLIPHKEARYIVPVLPPVAILTSAGINAIPPKFIRRILWALLVLVGVGQFYMISFGWPCPIEHYFGHPPLCQDWKEEDILKELRNHLGDRPVRIGMVVDNKYFNGNTFEFYINFFNLPYAINGDVAVEYESKKKIGEYDIFITKSALVTDFTFPEPRDTINKWLVNGGIGNIKFNLWKEFLLPDGAKAQIYLKDGL